MYNLFSVSHVMTNDKVSSSICTNLYYIIKNSAAFTPGEKIIVFSH